MQMSRRSEPPKPGDPKRFAGLTQRREEKGEPVGGEGLASDGDQQEETFTCDACGRTFPKAWSEDDALAEAAALYPPELLTDAAVICDDCFRGMNQ